MDKPLKVLHITTCFGMGGAETWMLALAKLRHRNETIKKQIQLDFLVIGGYDKNVLDDAIVENESIIHYTKFSIKGFFSFSKELKKILKSSNYDVMHSHLDFTTGWIFLAGLGCLPKCTVSHSHNPYLNIKKYIKQKPYRFISFYGGRWLMYLLSKRITGTSKAVMQDFGYYKFPYKQINYGPVYCGIDVHTFKTKIQQEDVVEDLKLEYKINSSIKKLALFIGRIDLDDNGGINQKNPKFAFEIAKNLVQNHQEWGFLFVGKKGTLAVNLEQECKILGIADKIIFTGIRTDIPKLLSGAAIFVFPAISEGLGMVLVEAQAAGVPVLTSTGVPREACIIEALYYTQPLTNSVDAWVMQINKIAAFRVDKMKANSQVYASAFAIENSMQNLIALYKSVLIK